MAQQHECKHEARITMLETKTALADNNIAHLVERLDGLTNILTRISVLLFGVILTSMSFLISYWVKGGV